MRQLFIWAIAFMAFAPPALATGCGKPKPDQKAEAKPAASTHKDEPAHAELAKRVRLTPQLIADAKIKTVKVTRETLITSLSLPGELSIDPDHAAEISSPLPGRVQEVTFKEGSVVKKNDVLARVAVTEIGKLRAVQSSALAHAKAARAEADRLAPLVASGVRAQQELLNAEAQAKSNEAEASGIAAQLAAMSTAGSTLGGSSQIVLRAPMDGVILTRDAVVGGAVTSERPLAKMADLSEAWFLARVFEKDLGKLRVGAKADVTLNAYPAESFAGTVDYLSRQIDPVARTVTARIRVANRDDLLRIGLFGTARIATGDATPRPAVLVIPRSAIIEIAGKHVAFVRHPDDDFELHELVLGETSVGKVEVVSGLREGEEVVSEGAFTLKSMVLKSTLAEED